MIVVIAKIFFIYIHLMSLCMPAYTFPAYWKSISSVLLNLITTKHVLLLTEVKGNTT